MSATKQILASIHPGAIVEARSIGPGTSIEAFAHISRGARLGANCRIAGHTFLENDVTLGDRVTVERGVQVWDGVTLENDVFVGPNATFANRDFGESAPRQTLVKS